MHMEKGSLLVEARELDRGVRLQSKVCGWQRYQVLTSSGISSKNAKQTVWSVKFSTNSLLQNIYSS